MAKAEYKSAVRSRRLIRRALAELLQEKALDQITVTDVVTRADINRGTFYAHYPDIPSVLGGMVDEACAAIRSALAQRPSGGAIPDPGVLLRHLQALLEEDLEFYRSTFLSSAAGPIVENLRNVFVDYMVEHEKDYRVGSHEQYLFAILFGSGGVTTLYRDWFAGRLPLTLDDLTEKAAQTVRQLLAQAQSGQT